MKGKIIIGIVFSFFLQEQRSEAQIWKKVQKKLEDKVEKKVDQVINRNDSPEVNGTDQTGNADILPHSEENYSFAPGSQVIFEDNFSGDLNGRMAKYWKSSGGGSVVQLPDVSGQWLALAPRTTYRIDSLVHLPENFTIEFDLITRSEEARDIGGMGFGFARDNSNRSYIMDAHNDNAITHSSLHFHNKEVTNSSSDTKIYNPVDFPLNNFSNGTLHVAIMVEGEHMRLYVNKAKLLDTRMFKKDAVKYFYISAPFSYKSDAMVYFGNFVAAALD
ncbi:hypothetical protein H8S90_03220 [Olivibacter sp. SDN3]|uniref:hypothetical protein n=1 Tax=Olivibacter sp. SDN3 TaxID=2764720 RepID=UPI001651A7D9|nr:hypothetical protein [Olivibacter sp. SDN3]QNL50628.1 hypothetical protein H8S90_03220 [Olivibacter sp. SDN3]